MNNYGKRTSPSKVTIQELKQMVIDSEETIWNVAQLAEIIGTSPQAIRKRIMRGAIPAHKEGHSWYILKSEYISNLRCK